MDWLRVKLPESGNGVLSCSVSCSGSVWVIDYQCSALLRTGVCRENPHGTGWLSVDNGPIKSGIRQVSAGSSSVWALDNTGSVFYRAGVSEERPQGLKWVHIPANMSHISVSHTNQVTNRQPLRRNLLI